MVDIKLTYKKSITSTTIGYNEYRPKRNRFAEVMKDYLFRSSDWIESKLEIDIPFTVKYVINKKINLAWRADCSRMVCICLEAADGKYAIVKDNEEFEIFSADYSYSSCSC